MKKIKEGGKEFFLSDKVFYNSKMTLNRDISVLLYKNYEGSFLDANSATGIRGIRLERGTLCDVSGRAFSLIKKNLNLNNLDLEVVKENCNVLMHKRHFDIVDLDPFGSPAPFIDSAVRSARKLLAVTATDTTSFSGTYPRVTRRKYGANVKRTPFHNETGLRILAGFVIRQGAKWEKALRPVFSHSVSHYHRIYFEVKKGAKASDKILKEIKYLEVDYPDRKAVKEKTGIGPLFAGNLWKKSLVKKMLKDSEKKEILPSTKKLLSFVDEEIGGPPFYYDLHALCKFYKIRAPAFSELPFSFSRTHFCDTGFRTEEKIEKEKLIT